MLSSGRVLVLNGFDEVFYGLIWHVAPKLPPLLQEVGNIQLILQNVPDGTNLQGKLFHRSKPKINPARERVSLSFYSTQMQWYVTGEPLALHNTFCGYTPGEPISTFNYHSFLCYVYEVNRHDSKHF